MDSNILKDYFNLNKKLNEIKIERDKIRKEIIGAYPDKAIVDDYVLTIYEKQGNVDYKAICETFLNLSNINLDSFRKPSIKVLSVKYKDVKTNTINNLDFDFSFLGIFGEDD